MHLDDEGFYRSSVDETLCKDCGLCTTVCYKFDNKVKMTLKDQLSEKRFYADYVPENNDKCMSMCLKDYMGVKRNKSINAIIEHGLFCGDFVSHSERVINVPSIITFGRQRVKHLRDRGIEKTLSLLGLILTMLKVYWKRMSLLS